VKNSFWKLIVALNLLLLFAAGCADKSDSGNSKDLGDVDVANSPERDAEIQKYNLELKKKLASERTPCDDIAITEFVINHYAEGTYLVDIDNVNTYNQTKPALLNLPNSSRYIFGIIAKSKIGERLIEPENIVGYNQSYIDLDSTELGTAFFYLTLFECVDNEISVVWEKIIPSHGGFNTFSYQTWKYRNIPYIKVNFHYARGSGHIDYNYFLINGIRDIPHLMMTYEGINFKRTIANIDDNEFPDFYEHIYFDPGDKVVEKDSVGFIWNLKDSVYVNTRNNLQTRSY